METTCLIIDDENQEKIFESNIKNTLKAKGINVTLIFIDVSSSEVRDEELRIDKNKFENKFKEAINGKNISVIACDYNLADNAKTNKIMGTDLVEIIRKERKRTPIILYSGNYETVIKDIFESYKNGNTTEIESIDRIKKLYNSHISDFLIRASYPDRVNAIITDPPEKSDQIILDELRKYGKYNFQSAYPIFEGKTLSSIADEIDKNTYDGKRFISEIIQQVTSYMIEINTSKP